LTYMGTQAPMGALKSVAYALKDRIQQGYALSAAMQSMPQSFPPLYYQTVMAGELSGHLAVVLEQLADYTEQQEAMRKTIRQALAYPVTVLGIALAIVGFLLYYVVPKIVGVFAQTGQALPLLTKVLLRMSACLGSSAPFIALLLVGLYGLHRRMRADEGYLRMRESLWLGIPGLRSIVYTVQSTLFFKTLDILLSAGLPMVEAVEGATRVVGFYGLRERLYAAQESIRAGATVYDALGATHMFSPMALCLLASGENTGRLEAMVHRIAQVQEQDFRDTMKSLLTLLEPLMIVGMGLVILFIVLAVLLPIFSMDAQAPA
jgi:general secretion pathway protein F